MNALSLVEKIACLSSADKEWLERLIDRFLVSPQRKGCDCHIVDPKKQDIIIWPSQNPKHPNDLIVQFTNQKFIGMPRVDKRGEKYWKVREFYENAESELKIAHSISTSSLSQKELELVKSYQEKVKANYKMEDFSLDENRAYCKWKEEQTKKVPENVPNQGENNHER